MSHCYYVCWLLKKANVLVVLFYLYFFFEVYTRAVAQQYQHPFINGSFMRLFFFFVFPIVVFRIRLCDACNAHASFALQVNRITNREIRWMIWLLQLWMKLRKRRESEEEMDDETDHVHVKCWTWTWAGKHTHQFGGVMQWKRIIYRDTKIDTDGILRNSNENRLRKKQEMERQRSRNTGNWAQQKRQQPTQFKVTWQFFHHK